MAEYLDRVIIVQPAQAGPQKSCLAGLYEAAACPMPEALWGWEEQVTGWCDEYRRTTGQTELLEVPIDSAVFIFDRAAERVVLAYALSVAQLHRRDARRMRGFPDVNVGVRARLGDRAFLADRGHFLGHASGGVLDINLFPHRRELNRGWSAEGRRFREMEHFVAAHPSVFFYHRPVYRDDTWIPWRLEYGVLVDDNRWWVEQFQNQ